MHPIQDVILQQLEVTGERLSPAACGVIEAALEATPAFDDACVIVGLLERRGSRGLARELAGLVAAAKARVEVRTSERLGQRAEQLRAFVGSPRPSAAPSGVRPVASVPLASLYVPRRFG